MCVDLSDQNKTKLSISIRDMILENQTYICIRIGKMILDYPSHHSGKITTSII